MKKKIISVVLAAAMLCAILTAFSSAYEDANKSCQLCGGLMYDSIEDVSSSKYRVSSCSMIAVPHDHENHKITRKWYCGTPNCYFHTEPEEYSESYNVCLGI